MEGLTLEIFTGYGIFGILFGFLFIYTIKQKDASEKKYQDKVEEIDRKNEVREQRYLEIISNYSKSIDANTAAIERLADELEK